MKTTLIHANTASVGKLHTAAVAAIQEAGVLLGRSDFYSEHYSELNIAFAKVRRWASTLLGVNEKQISLQSSTSAGLACLLNAIPESRRKVIAYPRQAFSSLIGLALNLKDSSFVAIGDRFGRITSRDLNELNTKPNVVVAEWINWISGAETDLADVANWCRKNGTFLLIDGVQGFGIKTLNALPNGVDGFVSGLQKWCLSPEGSAFAYFSPRLIEIGQPRQIGYQSLVDFRSDYRLHDDARKFETGTLSLASFVGASAAVQELTRPEISKREAALKGLIRQIVTTLEKMDRTKILFDSTGVSGILAFQTEGQAPENTLSLLKEAGVIAQIRSGWVRLSPCPFTDNDALGEALDIFRNSVR